MSYIDKNLIPGEQVMYRTRLHWIVIFWHLIWAIVLFAAGVYLLAGLPGMTNVNPDVLSYARYGGIILVVLAIVSFIMSLFRRNSVVMAVTNKRVSIKVGIVRRSTEEMLLTRIESIMVDQSVTGRMLNYGTITLRGVGGTPDPFPNIAHPLEFRKHVQQQLEGLQPFPPLQNTVPPQL